jgi:hypothetical protein
MVIADLQSKDIALVPAEPSPQAATSWVSPDKLEPQYYWLSVVRSRWWKHS